MVNSFWRPDAAAEASTATQAHTHTHIETGAEGLVMGAAVSPYIFGLFGSETPCANHPQLGRSPKPNKERIWEMWVWNLAWILWIVP